MFEITFVDEEHHRKFTFDNVDEIRINDKCVRVHGNDFIDSNKQPYAITALHNEYTYITIYQN